ncbi:unnamed protein product [Rhizoctonia solani]|uniref:Uncharacterized protein n=1 Tax=Rhizoctonia solani TaxID=456999 RepID=A0A8H3HLF9_9AGAM|nr:unnamed protein product [Rhizoctonia solani]
MSTLPVRGSRTNKPHVRKPYEREPPTPAPQLARSKSSFFNIVKTVLAGWFGGDPANGSANRQGEDKHVKRRASRSKLENGARPKRIRTVSPQRKTAPRKGYLDPPEHMIRPGGSLGRSSKLAVTSDSEQGHLSVRNTPLGFGTYRPPRSPSRRTPSISSWFPQPASTRNSLAPRASQVHFGIPSNLEIDTAIASHDDSRMQSRSPSVGVGVGVGLGRERTPSKTAPAREANHSLPVGGRTSLSKATGSNLRTSVSAGNPFSSLGKSASLAPERRKPTLVWDDTVGVTKAESRKARAPTAPPAKNTAERLLNALENMHTLTGDAQRPRRRPPPYVQVPAPGLGDRRARMIQPYGEVKVAPNKPKKSGKSGEENAKSGLMKMLMKNKKEVQEEDMDMEAEAAQSSQPKAVATAEQIPDKAKATAKDDDMEMESDSALAPKPATATAGSPPKAADNFRPSSQPPSRPGSSLRQSKTVTKRAHAHSAGRNRFSANNEEEEGDEEAAEKRNAELLAVANTSVFKVPEGFKFGAPSAPATPERVEVSKGPEVVSPQPIPAKPIATSVLSFTPPAKEAASPAPSFFSSKEVPKVAVPDVKNPFANIGSTKPEIKVPEVPKWGSAPSSTAPTPPPKPTEGTSPFANIGVPAKPVESAPAFSFGKPAEKPASDNPFASIGKPAVENPFGKIDKPVSDKPTGKPAGNPFASIGKPAGDGPFGGASKPVVDNPFAGIGASNKGASSAPAPSFSFGAPKSESAPTSTTPTPAIPSFFSKPVEAPKPAEAPKAAEVPKATTEPPKSSPFSFGANKPAEKPAASPFSFGVPAATPAPAPAPTSSPFSFGAPSAPVPTPAAPAPTSKPAFSFGVPATTPSPAPSVTEAPKKNPFDFSSAAPSAPTPAPVAPATSKNPFDFANTAKPADKPASPFAFGATPTPTLAPAPVPATSTTAEKKNPFDFSAPTPKPASSSPFAFGAPPAPASNGFTFGAAPARPSTPPSGGDAAMEESPTRDPAPSKIVTSGFGGATGHGFSSQPTSTGFAFGSNSSGTGSGPFGGTNGANTTGPFGGPLSGASTAQSNGLASATSASPAPFAFGASNNTNGGFGSTAGSGFGTSGSTAPSSTPFAFGSGGGFGQTPSATASPSNPFTQSPPNPTPFGQPNPTPTNAFPTPASPFPAASPALSTVGFNTNPAPSNNAFGSTQPATNGFPGSPATPAFAFGAPNLAVGTASPSTFTFGLPGVASTPATPTSTNSPFVFGQGGAPSGPEGSPAPGVQFNLGTADASPGGRKIKPLRRPRRN